jgi:Uma2 family endonuclease
MKAVMSDVPKRVLDARARIGADRWDEMWEGVLHMPPAPNREHQDLALALGSWLRTYWAIPLGNRVHAQVNVASPGGWPDDYRIPDLVLLTADRFAIDCNECIEGAPTVVIEIRSPGDETVEKMLFYARLGVPELWIIDRDTRVPQLHVLEQDTYRRQSPDPEGWLASAATGIRLRAEPGGKLAVDVRAKRKTRHILPDTW